MNHPPITPHMYYDLEARVIKLEALLKAHLHETRKKETGMVEREPVGIYNIHTPNTPTFTSDKPITGKEYENMKKYLEKKMEELR